MTKTAKKKNCAVRCERMVSENFDPLGSYTGNTQNWGEVPEQDADDL
ncbi:MAG: hypothetical protein IIW27_04115 [Clostridia bacterium]|jgi:hypothetical protein|nr:hypothetical protein [Clostridia bacterium]